MKREKRSEEKTSFHSARDEDIAVRRRRRPEKVDEGHCHSLRKLPRAVQPKVEEGEEGARLRRDN